MAAFYSVWLFHFYSYLLFFCARESLLYQVTKGLFSSLSHCLWTENRCISVTDISNCRRQSTRLLSVNSDSHPSLFFLLVWCYSLFNFNFLLSSFRRRAAWRQGAHQKGGGVKACGTCGLTISASRSQPCHLGWWNSPSTAASPSCPTAPVSTYSSTPHCRHPNGAGCHRDAFSPAPSAQNADCCSSSDAQQLPASQELFLPSTSAGDSSTVVLPSDQSGTQWAADRCKAWSITASGSDQLPGPHQH